jgi:hypothetical protein
MSFDTVKAQLSSETQNLTMTAENRPVELSRGARSDLSNSAMRHSNIQTTQSVVVL